MKWLTAIAGLLLLGAATAFWLLDSGTALMVVFAAVAAGFFGSAPWIIGGVMDRKGASADRDGARVVRFDEDRPKQGD